MIKPERKKVLLIGANGLTGRAFKNLFSEQYDIISLNRDENRDLSVLLTEDISTVIFLAQSADYKSAVFTEDLFAVNVNLIHRVLLASANKNRKFIYFSTGSVYQFQEEEVYELSPINTASGNPYIASKLMGEELVHTFSQKFEKTFIVRPFFIYGKGQKDSMLFSVMKNKLLHAQPIELASGKGFVFNPVFVNDAAHAIHTLIEKEVTNNNVSVINLAGKEETSLADVVNKMAEILKTMPNIITTPQSVKRMIANTITPHNFGTTSITEGLHNFLQHE
jgi:nucleoside-diphosphate-sugar epimerase